MKTSSAKAKGRRLQQLVRDALRKLGVPLGLVDGDIESRGMGQSGVDVIFSPAAKSAFPLEIECKNTEKLSVGAVFEDHYSKYAGNAGLKVLIHSKNRAEPLATLRFTDFLILCQQGLRGFNGERKISTAATECSPTSS